MSLDLNRSWIAVFVVALVVLLLLPMLWMSSWGGMMGSWGMGSRMIGFGFAWPLMFLVPLAFVVLVILGVYYLLSGHSSSRHEENDALRILKERYARSEITSEQYAKMKRDLES